VLLTDRFTYIHQPKTGGTFVATVLSRLHQGRGHSVRTVWFDPSGHDEPPDVGPGTVVQLMLTTPNQHGARKDIPSKYLGRPIVATVANPYARYVSQYEFAWWRVFPEMFGPVAATRRRYPAFPDLTFREFVELTNEAGVAYKGPAHPNDTPGFFTQQFAECFLADPDAAYSRASDDSFATAAKPEIRSTIRFLDQARLGEELGTFLEDMGYSPTEVETARTTAGSIASEFGPALEDAWAPYYTPELRAYVRRKERWLFEWFPEFDA
jgi:hypothetical protein